MLPKYSLIASDWGIPERVSSGFSKTNYLGEKWVIQQKEWCLCLLLFGPCGTPKQPPLVSDSPVSVLHAGEWAMQPAAGSSKGYPAGTGLSLGFPGMSRGKGLCKSASPLLCRLYLYSARLFSLLMTAAISPGAFWGCFSKLYFWFSFSLACLRICRNKKTKGNKMHQLPGTQELLKLEQESRCPRWMFWTQALQAALITSWCPESICVVQPYSIHDFCLITKLSDSFSLPNKKFYNTPLFASYAFISGHFLRGSNGLEP